MSEEPGRSWSNGTPTPEGYAEYPRPHLEGRLEVERLERMTGPVEFALGVCCAITASILLYSLAYFEHWFRIPSRVMGVVGVVGFVAIVMGAALFGRWVYQGTRNLMVLQDRPLRFSPAVAVWLTVLPIVHLATWSFVADQLAIYSEGSGKPLAGLFAYKSRSPLVNAWYYTTAISFLLLELYILSSIGVGMGLVARLPNNTFIVTGMLLAFPSAFFCHRLMRCVVEDQKGLVGGGSRT